MSRTSLLVAANLIAGLICGPSSASAQAVSVVQGSSGGTGGVVILNGPAVDSQGSGPAPAGAAGLPFGIPPRDQPLATGTGRIRGRVVASDTGRPLRRATLRLSAPGIRESRTTNTDQNGAYEFIDLPASQYTLTASRSGYIQMGYRQTRPGTGGRPIALGENQTLDRIDITLPPGGVITGRVVDEFGEPVPETTVSAQRQQFINGARRPMPNGPPSTSNDLGEFRIFGLVPGDYYISASPRAGFVSPFDVAMDRSGYGPTYYPSAVDIASAQRVTVRGGDMVSNIVITLSPTRMARVSGFVLDAQGQPVKNGTVMVTPAGNGSIGVGMRTAPGMVRPDGSFTINSVPPGSYMVQSAPNGMGMGPMFKPAVASITVDGSDLSNVIVQPVTPVTVVGRLSGDPATLAQVKPGTARLMAAPSGNSPTFMFGPGAPPQPLRDDLSFELSLSPGGYVIRPSPLPGLIIRAVRLDGRDVTSGFEVAAGATMNALEVEVTATTAKVIVTATNARGEAAPDRSVIVFPQDETEWVSQMPGHQSSGRTDENGTYQTPALLPGRYFVAVVEAIEPGESGDPEFLGSLRTQSQRITLGDGETANVQSRISER
jgi:uncharacterized GH25 family protein